MVTMETRRDFNPREWKNKKMKTCSSGSVFKKCILNGSPWNKENAQGTQEGLLFKKKKIAFVRLERKKNKEKFIHPKIQTQLC